MPLRRRVYLDLDQVEFSPSWELDLYCTDLRTRDRSLVGSLKLSQYPTAGDNGKPPLRPLSRDEVEQIVKGMNRTAYKLEVGTVEIGFDDGDRRHNAQIYVRFTDGRPKHIGSLWTTGRWAKLRAWEAEELGRRLRAYRIP